MMIMIIIMIMVIIIIIIVVIIILIIITITTTTIMIGKLVSQDCHRGKLNLSMAWVDIKKAYDYPLITSG